MHYTHAQDVVHRDLKPSNVLLEPRPDRAEHAGGIPGFAPRIADFGLAKIAEAPGDETRTGMTLGTPRYMAPEQAAGRAGAVGPGADVHALGVILYELLIGHGPFTGASDFAILAAIVADEPAPPRQLRAAIHGDLQTICLKCLQKEPGRRYASAGELAEDLRRFLRGEPILARPIAAWERTARAIKRHPAMASLAVLAGVAVLGLLVGAIWHRVQAMASDAQLATALAAQKNLQDDVARAETRARQLQYASALHQVQQAAGQGDFAAARRLLTALVPLAGQDDVRGFEWHYLAARYATGDKTWSGHTGSVYALAIADDGRTVATGGEDRQVILWDVATGRPRARLAGHQHPILTLAFTRDGKTLASAGGSYHAQQGRRMGEIKLWNAASGAHLANLPLSNNSVNGAAFSPDGKRLFLALTGAELTDRGRVAIWDLEARQEIASVGEHNAGTQCLALSPGGNLVASGGLYGRVLLWDLVHGERRPGPPAHQEAVLALAFDAAGHTLASAGQDRIVRCWNLAIGQQHAVFTGHEHAIWALAFSPDGRTLASGGSDRTLRLWDVVRVMEKRTLHNLPAAVRCLQFTPDGKALVFSGEDRLVRWLPIVEAPALPGLRDEVWSVAFTPDGKTLVTASDDRHTTDTVKLWEAATGRELAALRGHDATVSAVAVAPDGTTLATGSYDHTVKLWDLATRKERATLRGHRAPVRAVSWSRDGHFIASGSHDGCVKLWDATTGDAVHTFHSEGDRRVRAVAFAPDNRLLAAGSEDGRVRLWDTATRQWLRSFEDGGEVWSLAFGGDGEVLATGGSLGLVRLWEVRTGRELHFFKGHHGGVKAVDFSPDGRTLASAGVDRTVKLWQVATGLELATLDEHQDAVNTLAFAPDGRMLVSGSHDGIVKRWDAGTP